jgi:hypothetical protein
MNGYSRGKIQSTRMTVNKTSLLVKQLKCGGATNLPKKAPDHILQGRPGYMPAIQQAKHCI